MKAERRETSPLAYAPVRYIRDKMPVAHTRRLPKLTTVQAGVLSAYDRLGPLDDREDWSIIKRESGSGRAGVSRTVSVLIGLGLLRTTQGNGLRRNIARITEDGRQALKEYTDGKGRAEPVPGCADDHHHAPLAGSLLPVETAGSVLGDDQAPVGADQQPAGDDGSG